MKRRRIREIVAASLEDYTGDLAEADEITVTVRRPEEPASGVGINVLWGVAAGTSKREAFVVALAAHGWEREWPELTERERYGLQKRQVDPMNALWGLPADGYMSPDVLRDHFAMMEHLRERVKLP